MSSTTLLTFSTLFALVLSGAVPTAPAPGAIFKAGGECPIQWTPDTTGTWTNMKIEFMTGANLQMTSLETVAVVDATKLNNFTWPCPQVKPPAPIYFYQMSNNGDATTDVWTGRFTIADLDGTTVPAPNATQNGEDTPWGNGTIVQNFSTEVSGSSTLPPTVGNATSTSAATTTKTASSSSSSGSSSPKSTTSLVSSGSSSSSSSSHQPSQTGNAQGSSNSNGSGRLAVGGAIGFVAALLTLV